jgi:hypothetical protein
MQQQSVTRTIARLPGCQIALPCRFGFLYCLCETSDGESRLLRIAPQGSVEALPFGSGAHDWSSLAVRPDGSAIFMSHKVGRKAGEIWKHKAPRGSAPPELVVNGQGAVHDLEVCEEG